MMLGPVVLWSPGGPGVGWTAGHGKTTALEVRRDGFRYRTADEKTFAEWGWQWSPWDPPFAGTDFRPYNVIVIELRMMGPQLPTDLLLSLASPGDHHTSPRASLFRREPHLADGRWHRISVPLATLRDPKGLYDPGRTIQIILGAWNGERGNFIVDVRRVSLAEASITKP